jgi:hypothetical protein
MKAVNSTIRRIVRRRHCSFLTHGGDDHDHRGLNRARREEGKAIVRSWTPEGEEPAAPVVEGETTFRVVVTTQVYENYATHACECGSDESCTCGDYWKAKGGHEYHRNVGTANEVLALGSKGVEAVASAIKATLRCNRFFEEYEIGWELVPSTEETYEERMYREMHEEGCWWPAEHADEIYAKRLAALQA